MKNLIYILNMLMILIFASCKDENAFMPGDDGLTCYSILVSAPNNATRAYYEESGENIAVKWEKGDVIDVDGKQFVYKEDRKNNAALFVLYAESMPDVSGKVVKFGETENGVQIQSKNNKCHEVLVGTVPAGYSFTSPTKAIPLLPAKLGNQDMSLLHIQTKSPAMFMGKSLLKIKGLATEYTIQLGENPELVFADKNEQLDIYVTVATGTINSGKTLKFYFYAYDENAGDGKDPQTNGDEYHYYMKCNASITMENNEVAKMVLPNKPTHTAIQLGLSVKWATMNVGATSDQPGEASFGGYYPWGMVEPDYQMAWDNATSGNYLYGKTKDEIASFFSPYVEDEGIQGFYKEYGGKKYGDAATYNWGSDWVTPSWNQMNELMQQMIACRAKGKTFSNWEEWKSSTKTKTQRPKNNGWWVYGKDKYSEKKIWLPAAGGVHNKKLGGETNESPASNDGYNGIYMTSIRNSNKNKASFSLFFNGGDKTSNKDIGIYGNDGVNDFLRHHGVSVRPVRKSN